MADISTICAFWREAGYDRWFGKDEAFDAALRERFLDAHFRAARREFDAWADDAEGLLALMILLDQLPRNVFRGSAHMFATDPLALAYARRAVEAGLDQAVEPALRAFIYLPFEHSEVLADQDASVALNTELGAPYDRYAVVHRDVIVRFGRFPHRNPMLGRDTTPEEQAFLDSGGFSG